MSRMSSGRRPPPPPGDHDQLHVLRDQLRQRGWEARVLRYSLLGDVDVRLKLERPGSPAVELLGTCDGLRCHDRWQAVRTSPEGRAVWCGPSRNRPQAEVIAFLEELLRRNDTQLAERYTRLG